MLTHNNVFVLNHAHDATTIYATTQLSKVAALLLLCMLYSCFYDAPAFMSIGHPAPYVFAPPA